MQKVYLKITVAVTCFILGITMYKGLGFNRIIPEMESSRGHTLKVESTNKDYNIVQGFGRNLSYYDISKEYFDGLLAQPNDRNTKQEIRKFIWEHFTAHQRGYIRVTIGGWEGQKLTQHIFIEPDSKGYWQISCIYFEDTYCRNGLCDLGSVENLTLECEPLSTSRSSEFCNHILIKNKNGQIFFEF